MCSLFRESSVLLDIAPPVPSLIRCWIVPPVSWAGLFSYFAVVSLFEVSHVLVTGGDVDIITPKSQEQVSH